MNTMNDMIIRGLRESDYVLECYEIMSNITIIN